MATEETMTRLPRRTALLAGAAGVAETMIVLCRSSYPRYRSASTNRAKAAEDCRRLGYQR